ncbi:MAG TPA: AAA family ATPase [Noviherbaspirillum sp.]|uniref:AAA family ATPase n=1 Tax=Noviherbaspirillum sp. TaxID=1926288 RepID=UPI002DDCC71F|nr:AAA family ATPase [Noviherbaspirillum sp.]HEV2611771.1 AAA family ATPase [Noviherbaspirillum sp.]
MGNYQVIQQIGLTAGGTLYVARHEQDGTTALLKLPPRECAVNSLRHEYALLQSLDAPEILKPIALQEDSIHPALVLEFFPGESLDVVLARQPRLDLRTALDIALQSVRALAALHAAGFVHHDIRPANFLLAHAPHGIQVKLADASRATARESATSSRPAAGSDWAYVSPEQTGRMKRQADYRTDFYSLGILLYRLLTGQLPFQANDALEWVHCHLARMPVPPHYLVPDLPHAVSHLVLKLLAKVPEDRYQSASGLLADLAHCLDQWQATGAIAPFPLGTRDVSDRFHVPHKLYGREQERAALLNAFERIATAGGRLLVTVAGYSGVGKSALVHDLQQPIMARHGYFVAGKFDQYKRDIPYATLAQALDQLVRQILGEDDASIARWRQALCEALSPVGQLMVNLIPQLELIIGPQPPVPVLPPQEAQGRFQLVFRRFLGVFARQEHPLVLFLDDLQWADAGTLAVLADLVTHPDMHSLLLIGAYRDNEVGDSPPLRQRLEAIRQAGGRLQRIVLASLSLDELAQLVAESMHCRPDEAQPLAQLLLDKTGGNPFFTKQFLATLADEKLLSFDDRAGTWRWNMSRIHAMGYTDNVVELIVGKLGRLPNDTRDALARFAFLGNAADTATLAIVLGQPAEAIHALFREAACMGPVFRQADTYLFLHDGVQEAAYSMIPETLRAVMHLHIGRMLASSLAPEALANRIFELVSQFNRGSSLVESREEKERIAELNLLAGKRARAATAFASALAFVTAGTALLTEDCWERRHELIFELELIRAECEFLTSALAAAEERLALLSMCTATAVERASVACLRADLYTHMDRSDRAVEVGLDCLRHIGIDLSPQPTQEQVRGEYDQTMSRLGERPIDELIDLPLMTDPASLATLDVLTKIGMPAMFTDANLYSLLSCKAVSFSLTHGNSAASCFAYGRLGMIAGSMFGDYHAAYRLARLGCLLVERRGLTRFESEVYFTFAARALLWAQHIRAGHDLLLRAFEAGNRNGNIIFASVSCTNIISNLLATGAPLSEVQREAEHRLAFVQKARFGMVVGTINSQLALARTLLGLTPIFGTLDDAQFNEDEEERRYADNPRLAIGACWYWIRKLQVRFLAGDFSAALAAAMRAKPLLWTSWGFFETVEYHYYGALACAALCDSVDAGERAPHMEALRAHHRELDAYAKACPENFANRAALLGAEIARLEDRKFDAELLYEQAIRSARDNGFVHNEGIASELAARFYLAYGLSTAGNAHLERARDCYAEWEESGKVRQLEERYPQLRAHALSASASDRLPDGASRLDMLSAAKASQAISGRIVLDELIDALMRVVLENAGAQTGCLLLVKKDELTLAAEAEVEQQAVQVRRQAGRPRQQTHLPMTILQYVRRSRESVLLMDAAESHPFSNDPYFARQRPQSVLCLPILRQSTLVGVLYLENNLTTHAFTPDRVQVLELLACQAAISLDNARLYADVRDSHARIRRLVESSIIGIVFWNLSGGITDANEAFLQMVGYSRQDLADGKVNWESMTLPEYKALDEQKLTEVRATRTSTPYEKEFLHKDGSRIPVLLGAVLFDDSPDHGVAFVLDLTERKRAEAEREARHAAEAANRAKSAFLATMSHELRTPLNSILGYAQILERDQVLGERQLAGVNVIRKSGEHLLTLINDILDLAKIEAGRMELVPVDIPLARFVQNIIEIVAMKAAQKELEFVRDFSPSLPQWIRADEKRLRQVLLNLLSNAIKFTDRGRVVLRVRFTPPDRLCFEVQDTGIGIAADRLKAIFEPFEQACDMQRRVVGTGLGLTISQQYVHLMGGRIEAESRLGQGSTFRFEVEAHPVQRAMAATSSRIVTGYAGPRRRVLVVDDIAENRMVAVDLLTPLGFEVAEASKGREGVEMAQRLQPDLILMDLVMPEMDGLEAMRLLCRQAVFRDLPIIVMSASVSASDSEQSLAAGAHVFLPKPLETDKLLAQIARLLRLEWTYDAAQAASPPEEEAIVAPPADEMEVLYRLARLGNMHEIAVQADRLDELDECYRPFASRLRSLAINYQSQAVLLLVEKYRQSSMAS